MSNVEYIIIIYKEMCQVTEKNFKYSTDATSTDKKELGSNLDSTTW
jgi:hypothetical protein